MTTTQELKAFKIARERMKLKGEINELKMKLSEPPNFNKYVNDLQDKIRLLESDKKAQETIRHQFYEEMEEWKWMFVREEKKNKELIEENKKLKKELVDVKSKKAKITKERRTFELAYKNVKNKLNLASE